MPPCVACVNVTPAWDIKHDCPINVPSFFDKWAMTGLDERLEEGHGYSVRMYLRSTILPERFSFLDVGCGNGWVVRMMSRYDGCHRAVGIDKSAGMINNARRRIHGHKEEYFATPLEEWDMVPFDIIFSMESLYYMESMSDAIAKIHSLLVPGGIFICGTDYYAENQETQVWGDLVDDTMHLLSESQWVSLFEDAGFGVRATRLRNPGHPVKWKRDEGTLFLVGKRQD